MLTSDGFFNELMLNTQQIVKTYVSHHCSDPYLAEDIVQEVFVTAYMKIDMLKNHPCPEGWLIKTAYLKCAKIMKKEYLYQNRTTTIEDKEYLTEPVDDRIEEKISSKDMVQRLFRKLTPRESKILKDVFMEERPIEELAEEANVSGSAYRMRLQRVKKKAVIMLKEEEKD